MQKASHQGVAVGLESHREIQELLVKVKDLPDSQPSRVSDY
ncbi:MAG: hypothetical protein [Olavius algarvensis Delta 4 endosymbiont]|nr:MAG: hypothetical protein [Olavius algarvensis Delta 4 endosymbiont]